MSFNLKVDISPLGITPVIFPAAQQAIRNAIQASLAVIRDKWQTDVQNKLNSTRSIYLQGLGWDSILFPLDSLGFSGAVQLNGILPNMIEKGFSAFDMKSGFQKSFKRRTSNSGGWYLTIPFRHTTPGSSKDFGNPMPQNIYDRAKTLQGKQHLSFPGKGNISWKGYQWKNTKYHGLTRIIKSYQNTTQSQYYTFRRVSNNSDPNSWWHPGYKGLKEAEALMPYAKSTFVDLLIYNLNGLI